MTLNTDIVFLDIETAIGTPVSPNTWKVRLFLNYRKFKYETKWVLSTQIAATCKSLGIPPTGTYPNGDPHYTLPAILDKTPEIPVPLSDSTPIIEYLDRTYPSPSPSRMINSYDILFRNYFVNHIVIYAPALFLSDLARTKVPKERDAYMIRMANRFGKKYEDIEVKGPEREQMWIKGEKDFELLARCFDKNTDGGEFFNGKQVSLTDFELGGFLVYLSKISPNDGWGRIASWQDGRWARFVKAFENCMAVDNYPQ